MIPGGYSPTERPKTTQEYQAGRAGELYGSVRRSSSKGAWITLAVVLIVLAALVLLVSLLPDAPAATTTLPLPPDAPTS